MLRLPPPSRIAVSLLMIATAASAQRAATGQIQKIRFWSFGNVTRIAIQTDGAYKLLTEQIENPSRICFDFAGLRPSSTLRRGIQAVSANDQRVRHIRIAELTPAKTRLLVDLKGPVELVSSQLVNPDRLMIELRPKGTSLPALSVARSVPRSPQPSTSIEALVPSSPSVRRPPSTSDEVQDAVAPVGVAPAIGRVSGAPAPALKDSRGDRSLVRVFGLKPGKIVIDAGHGGHDTGTIGPDGLMEKDLVLDIALRLGKLVGQQLGATVVYTRSDDTFIPLEERTRIANSEKADLFISIHANSSPEPSATGVETYFFNLSSDPVSLNLATRENASATSAISDLNDLLHKAVLQTKLEESREFAQKVQNTLWLNSTKMNNRSRDRGVRQAPFLVLIGATMPSILTEVGFVSNQHDEKALSRGDQRQHIAEALFKGISQYTETLSHVQMARSE